MRSAWASGRPWVPEVRRRPPVDLSGELRAHVQAERFQIVTSIRGLPLGVRAGLETLFGSRTLDIADPGESFKSAT